MHDPAAAAQPQSAVRRNTLGWLLHNDFDYCHSLEFALEESKQAELVGHWHSMAEVRLCIVRHHGREVVGQRPIRCHGRVACHGDDGDEQ